MVAGAVRVLGLLELETQTVVTCCGCRFSGRAASTLQHGAISSPLRVTLIYVHVCVLSVCYGCAVSRKKSGDALAWDYN